jgi:arabinofuranan 3-O-arabinosyltransferase
VAACLLLVALALVQDPGYLVPDTKFDLVEAPVDFLGRALHLWDAEGAFGQLQNQAYGYLWPMGPFFSVGWLLDGPGWVVQRLWLALVLCVALVGVVKLTRALGVRSDLARLVAGFAFALSPRMLTVLGPISIEAWPSAVAPWVLLALVHGSRGGSPRRWAALSALAVACVGGVNAAATFAVVPLAALWLLTRSPGPRRRALMGWWTVLTLLGTAWWLAPLFVMGSYSPPFLDYIETTTVTTFPTTLFDTLRGTSNWVPYLDAASRAGNDLITTPYLVLNSGVVLMVGLAGLLDRRTPERAFLALGTVTGVLMVSAGHTGVVEGLLSGDVRALLDGALSPLRNVHKFDVVLRLPLVLGLACVLDRAVRRRGEQQDAHAQEPQRSASGLPVAGQQLAVVAMVVLAVAGASLPAALGRVTPAGRTLDVPAYWQQTADWLAAHDEDGTTSLVVPGTNFATYVWGSPRDEPMQYLAGSPWAVRNVIPLAPPGGIRVLDEIERRLVEGRGSPGFADYLRRAGVRYLVLRNDVRAGEDVPQPVVVHQSLARSGLTRVADFGPQVGAGASLETDDGTRVVLNDGWQSAYPAVEVYEVPGATARAVTSGPPPVVVGGPEDLADLADLDLLGDGSTRLAADLSDDEVAAGPEAPVVLTDGLRGRERFFARIHDGYSATLAPGDTTAEGNQVRDYLVDDGRRWTTRATYDGAAAVSASSSGSDPGGTGGSRRGQSPFAAVDGVRDSEWVSRLGVDETTWWDLRLDEPRAVTSVRLVGGATALATQEVRVVTDAGASDPVELGPGRSVTLRLPSGETRHVRVEDASGVAGRLLALAEVRLPGVTVERRLATPALPSTWDAPDAVVLRGDLDARTGCVEIGADVRCAADRVRGSEDARDTDRTVDLPRAASYDVAMRVAVRGGPEVDRLVQRGQPIQVRASTSSVPDPRGGPVAAVDGDDGTTWTASVDDPAPTLTMRWLGEKTIDAIRIDLDDEVAARIPTRVRLTWPGGSREVRLDDGRAEFRPFTTDQLQLRVESGEDAAGLDLDAEPSALGVGISELELEGLDYLPLGLSADERASSCGAGPQVTIGGRTWSTVVDHSPLELLRAGEATARLCDPASPRPRTETTGTVDLPAGPTDVSVRGSRGFALSSMVLTRRDGDLPRVAVTSTDETGSAVRRTLEPHSSPPAGSVVELRQNVNPGWVAEQGGQRLRPVTLDGWKQGWVLAGDERGTAAVEARFAPDVPYRWGLAGGALALLVLLLSALPRRRAAAPAPLTERRLAPWVAAPVVALLTAATAGWAGLVVAAVSLAAWTLVTRRWSQVRDDAAWVLGATAFVVACWYAVRPWGDQTGWAGQAPWTVYVLVPPLVVLVWSASRRRDRTTRARLSPFRRRAGRSSSR